jgi:hypothetical protein
MQAASFPGWNARARARGVDLASHVGGGLRLSRLPAGYFVPLSGRSEPEHVAVLSGACLSVGAGSGRRSGCLTRRSSFPLTTQTGATRGRGGLGAVLPARRTSCPPCGRHSAPTAGPDSSAFRGARVLHYCCKRDSVATARILKLLPVASMGGRWLATPRASCSAGTSVQGRVCAAHDDGQVGAE